MNESDEELDERPGSRLAFMLVDAVEELGGAPPNTWWNRVVGAFLGPLVLGLAGLRVVLIRKVAIYNPFFKIISRPKLTATGMPAVAAGLALICLALAIHFRCFWYARRPVVGAAGMISSFFLAVALMLAFAIGLWLQ